MSASNRSALFTVSGDKRRAPLSSEEVAAIKEGLAAAARGELTPHERVVAEIRAKFARQESADE